MTKSFPLKPKARILIVEDENIVALHLERSLSHLGYVIVGVVNNGSDAIRKAGELRPDLILMDIQLKGELDGIVAAQKIREWLNAPVIFLTAYSDDKTLERAKASEPYGYLLKPFEESELSTTIEIVLHKHQMTLLKQQESSRALKKSEESFQLLVESVVDYGIFMVDPLGFIVSWNPGAERISGYKAADVIGKNFSIFYSENEIYNGKPLNQLRNAAARGHFEEEGWRLRQNGTPFWANVVIVPLRDEEGNIRGFGKVVRDLTERKKAEDALRSANESLEQRVQERTADLGKALEIRDEFLSVASHELKNALTSLSLQLQLLRQIVDGKGEIPLKDRSSNGGNYPTLHKLVYFCETQGGKINHLLDELLDLTRIRIGKFELHRDFLDLSSIIEDLIDRKRAELAVCGVAVSVQANSPIMGSWDSIRIEQIIGNLLSNALKYGDGKPIEVSVELASQRRSAILKVRDHGKGITPEMQEKIFRRFERGCKNIPGMGLGLYIVQEIVKAHSGSIFVSSKVGEGATFTVELPIDVPEERRACSR